MTNTITAVTLQSLPKYVVRYITLQSDGSNETNTVVYDSSVEASNQGLPDSLTSSLLRVDCSCNAAATARVRLVWDATTKVVAMDIPTATNPSIRDFTQFGGLKNQGGSGITGDILLTTTGLASGDTITLVLTIQR